MRGDEDLGQDITMKGQPFHYVQEAPKNATKSLSQSIPACITDSTYGKDGCKKETAAADLVQFAEGMRGDEDLGQDITMKGQPFHYNQKNNERVILLQFAEGMRGDEDLGQDITMKGQPFHYAQGTSIPACDSYDGC